MQTDRSSIYGSWTMHRRLSVTCTSHLLCEHSCIAVATEYHHIYSIPSRHPQIPKPNLIDCILICIYISLFVCFEFMFFSFSFKQAGVCLAPPFLSVPACNHLPSLAIKTLTPSVCRLDRNIADTKQMECNISKMFVRAIRQRVCRHVCFGLQCSFVKSETRSLPLSCW